MKKIKEDFPKVWDDYLNWCYDEHKVPFETPSLYEYLDEKFVVLIIGFYTHSQTFHYSIYGKHEDGELANHRFEKFSSRFEAEEAGFYECFKILNNKLWN